MAGRWVFALALLIAGSLLPGCGQAPYPALDEATSPSAARAIVETLAVEIGPRDLTRPKALAAASTFIQDYFRQQGLTPGIQSYVARDQHFENIRVLLGSDTGPRLVVGAHYDSYGDTPGADDNASGVAALLLLAKKLKDQQHKFTTAIELVAFSTEEPPFFDSVNMGSYVHAHSLADDGIEVVGMLSLEMIGYYATEPGTQSYPIGLMRHFYPDSGNFVAVVSNFSSGSLLNHFRPAIEQAGMEAESLSAPRSLTGVDFSDHRNYWDLDIPAIMITDTSFYRNSRYHTEFDTAETLDYERMAKVIDGLFLGLVALATDS